MHDCDVYCGCHPRGEGKRQVDIVDPPGAPVKMAAEPMATYYNAQESGGVYRYGAQGLNLLSPGGPQAF